MSKTRFTPWVVLACIGTLAGCTSGEGGTAGNTDLNIVLPNGCAQDTTAPDCFDIQVVEYTIACDDGDPTPNGPFLDNGAGFDDRVVINGVLEVFDTPQEGRDGRAASNDPWTWGNTLGDIYVAQGFMDLPVTQRCTAQLRARTAPAGQNSQGEVICSDTVTFEVEADTVSTVNVLMYCGLSFQAPVAQLDLAGDFSFNVSNFCPDLFVLNCIDTDLDIRETAAGEFAVTACQVRFRDGDNSCGDSCDPQECTTAPEGLRCAPACQADDSCPTEPTTTVTCSGGELVIPNVVTFPGSIINCDGSGQPAANCVFNGNTLGVIGAPPPGPPPALGGPGPGEGGFFVACVLCDDDYVLATGGQDPRCPTATGLPLAPGATVTCTAVTTDGDNDCDKTKIVELTCPGLSPCDAFIAGGGTCDDGSICTTDTCVDANCDDTAANCCAYQDANEGEDCSSENPPLASCQSGACMSDACVSDADCENPATECMVAPTGACQGDGTCAAEVPGNFGDACDSGTGSLVGTCGLEGAGPPAEEGTCVSSDLCTVATQVADCGTNANECLLNQCNTSGTGGANDPAYFCETVPNTSEECNCDIDGLNCAGVCDSAGVCVEPPFVAAGTGTTMHRAGPRFCNAGVFPFIESASRPDCAQCLSDSCSGGSNALNACDTNADCPGGTCAEATPGPDDCPLDCFTFVCTSPTTDLFPGGGPGGACVYPTITSECPFAGCQIVSNTLKNQLAVDTFLTMTVTATGQPAREVTVEYDVLAVNAGLALAGPLASLDDVTLITNLTDTTLSFTTTKLDPALQGTSVDAYTGTGSFVLRAGFASDQACVGGPNDGNVCSTDGDCPDQVVCNGGTNVGNACDPDVECPDGGICTSICVEGSALGSACTTFADCPDTGGSFTSCQIACDGGSNDLGLCNPNVECPSASSGPGSGTGSCLQDAGSCENPFQLNPVTEVLIPTASPVDLAFDETIFNIALVIKSSGAPLPITGNACTFSNEAGTCFGGGNNLEICNPTIDNGGLGDPLCLDESGFPPFNVPGTCVRTNGAPVSLPATFP